MKNIVKIYGVSVVAAAALLLPVTGFAGLVIGDWESGLDGWADWSAGIAGYPHIVPAEPDRAPFHFQCQVTGHNGGGRFPLSLAPSHGLH